MKNFRLTVITENQKSLAKGQHLGKSVAKALGIKDSFEITKYDKYPDSYKMEFKGVMKDEGQFIFESIELTDRVCGPWEVKYIREVKEIALIFNQSERSNFAKKEFNVIRWGQFIVY